jgi:hypothetical protein
MKSIVHATLPLAALGLLAGAGCVHTTRYPSVAQTLPEDRAFLAQVDRYYLERAREQAEFSFACPSGQVVPSVVSTKSAQLALRPQRSGDWRDFRTVDSAAIISVIGAAGCGQRATYQVVCGPYADYLNAVTEPNHTPRAACDVVPSADVARAVERNAETQQQLAAQAAQYQYQQQQQQQRQQQQQQQPFPEAHPLGSGLHFDH